ncbi:MAG TPA: glycosyltransferase, partial [Thermohalobaculum sp.]|nr:glycosyltransferase [Thermohalobaculum sp.]
LTGILNGIDEDVWDPVTDHHLAQPYGPRNLNSKRANRRKLIERYRLAAGEGPVFGVVSRMTEQKGLDLLAAALPRLIARDGRLALLGDGDAEVVQAFREAASAWPGRIGLVAGWDETLAHRLIAGADAILLPSRFEPCGLTQLYGLRYATIPVVARTGGLADTVIDHNEAASAAECSTGFVHAPDSVRALADAIDRACDAFADPPAWGGLMARAAGHPVGWENSALAYADLYRAILEERA